MKAGVLDPMCGSKKAIKDLSDFLDTYTPNKEKNDFGKKLLANNEARLGIIKILNLQADASYKDIQKATTDIQNELRINPDGAFGKVTLREWLKSSNYGLEKIPVKSDEKSQKIEAGVKA